MLFPLNRLAAMNTHSSSEHEPEAEFLDRPSKCDAVSPSPLQCPHVSRRPLQASLTRFLFSQVKRIRSGCYPILRIFFDRPTWAVSWSRVLALARNWQKTNHIHLTDLSYCSTVTACLNECYWALLHFSPCWTGISFLILQGGRCSKFEGDAPIFHEVVWMVSKMSETMKVLI